MQRCVRAQRRTFRLLAGRAPFALSGIAISRPSLLSHAGTFSDESAAREKIPEKWKEIAEMTDAMRPVSPIPPARLATIRHHARWEQYVSKYPKYPLSIEPSISPRLSSLPSPPLLSSPLLSSPLLSSPLRSAQRDDRDYAGAWAIPDCPASASPQQTESRRRLARSVTAPPPPPRPLLTRCLRKSAVFGGLRKIRAVHAQYWRRLRGHESAVQNRPR